MLRERDEARAQVERVRPVVEAALAWGDAPHVDRAHKLSLAVQTYRAHPSPRDEEGKS
jgi:hypothetical protein